MEALAGRRPVVELLRAGGRAERVLIAKGLAPSSVLGEIRRRAEAAAMAKAYAAKNAMKICADAVQILGAQAWLAQSKGDKAEALKFMRAAADLEDGSEKHVSMENRLYPMRELLGDMLREHGEPAAALKEYEVSMKNAPNRLRGYYGASKAAQGAGDMKKAAAHFRSLARLTRDADGDRAELREMKQLHAAR